MGIETSCDETAAAVVENGQSLLSNVVATSIDLHRVYGGVVPEIAARNHIEVIQTVISNALKSADCTWEDIDAIAVTYGAGLSGSLLIGVLTARTLAIIHKKPLYAVNHVLAHVYSNFITSTSLPDIETVNSVPDFPLLAVIVSGGHTQLVMFNDHFDYNLLGQTKDDAIGEAFDKVAKVLGLPYPGGPSIAKTAAEGSVSKYKLPRPRMPGYDFSYSGLKTAVLRLSQAEIGERYDFPSIHISERLTNAQKQDIAAAFQYNAVGMVVDKVKQACQEFGPKSIVVAGGVGANSELRRQLSKIPEVKIQFPDIALCTDNGAMVGSLGYYMSKTGQETADPYKLKIEPNLSM